MDNFFFFVGGGVGHRGVNSVFLFARSSQRQKDLWLRSRQEDAAKVKLLLPGGQPGFLKFTGFPRVHPLRSQGGRGCAAGSGSWKHHGNHAGAAAPPSLWGREHTCA